MTRLFTERLVLIPVNPTHDVAIHSLHSDPFIYASIFDGVPPTEEHSQSKLSEYIQSWTNNGFGFWMVYQVLEGKLSLRGRSGFRYFKNTRDLELGYCFYEEASGKGFAFEAGQAACEFAIERLNRRKIVAVTSLHNERSANVLYKLGFACHGEILSNMTPKLYYELHK